MSDWKPIAGYGGRYEVSDDGLVRRENGALVGQWPNGDGYMLVRLSQPRRMFRVHRLVAQTFIANPDEKPCVNHKNNNRADNRAVNLEWCTQAENIAHADKQGRMCRDYWKGKRSPSAKLTEAEAQLIRSDYASGNGSYAFLADKYGTSKRTVERIIKGAAYV